MIGGRGCWTGLGSAGESVSRSAAGEREPLAGRRRPQPGDDRELLLQPVETLAERRERDAVGAVLRVEPAGAEPELDPAAAHLVDLGDADGERAGQPERGRGDQRAEPDRDVSRASPASVTHASVGPGQPVDVAHPR